MKSVCSACHTSASSFQKQSRQPHIAGQARARVARQLPARKKGRRVHVVLDVVLRHHHIAHVHPLAHATRHAGKDDARHAKALDECRGRGGRRHLANARQRQHHGAAVQLATPEGTSRVHRTLRVGQVLDQGALLLGQSAQDGGGHGRSLRHWHSRRGRTPRKGRPAALASPSFPAKPREGGSRTAAQGDAHFLSRSSRRRILPTGVLGSSVRNSTTRGCL